MSAIKTPLRYPGGKSKALKKIMPLIPRGYSEYREPFAGGASVFIAFKQKNPNAICKINDLNTDVYCFWKTLQERPNDLIEVLTHIKKNCKDGRSLYSKLTESYASGIFGRALRFYLLNRITYSGIADSGGYSAESFEKRFTFSRIRDLFPVSRLLQDVEITNNDYSKSLRDKSKNVFVFLDPPYWKVRDFSLYGKHGDLNKSFDHKRFAENVKKCKHTWLITCDDSVLIRELFSFANIYPWEMKYNGFNKRNAVEGKELFITNYDLNISNKAQLKLT